MIVSACGSGAPCAARSCSARSAHSTAARASAAPRPCRSTRAASGARPKPSATCVVRTCGTCLPWMISLKMTPAFSSHSDTARAADAWGPPCRACPKSSVKMYVDLWLHTYPALPHVRCPGGFNGGARHDGAACTQASSLRQSGTRLACEVSAAVAQRSLRGRRRERAPLRSARPAACQKGNALDSVRVCGCSCAGNALVRLQATTARRTQTTLHPAGGRTYARQQASTHQLGGLGFVQRTPVHWSTGDPGARCKDCVTLTGGAEAPAPRALAATGARPRAAGRRTRAAPRPAAHARAGGALPRGRSPRRGAASAGRPPARGPALRWPLAVRGRWAAHGARQRCAPAIPRNPGRLFARNNPTPCPLHTCTA